MTSAIARGDRPLAGFAPVFAPKVVRASHEATPSGDWDVTAVAAAALAPSAASAAVTLQPGAYHETDAGPCTLNFAYTGGGKTYLGTAAHCVSAVGQRVRDIEGAEFGRSPSSATRTRPVGLRVHRGRR